MDSEETPNQSTVGISYHFANEECFKISVSMNIVASFQIYSLFISYLGGQFSCFFLLPTPSVCEDTFLFDLLRGGFEPVVPYAHKFHVHLN